MICMVCDFMIIICMWYVSVWRYCICSYVWLCEYTVCLAMCNVLNDVYIVYLYCTNVFPITDKQINLSICHHWQQCSMLWIRYSQSKNIHISFTISVFLFSSFGITFLLNEKWQYIQVCIFVIELKPQHLFEVFTDKFTTFWGYLWHSSFFIVIILVCYFLLPTIVLELFS